MADPAWRRPHTADPAPVDRRRLAAAAAGGAALVAAGIAAAAVLTADRRPPPASDASAPVAPASAEAVQSVLFARLGRLPGTAQFVDPATGLPRTNTAVHCTARAGRSDAFRCVVSSASGAKQAFDAGVENGVVRISSVG